MQKVANEAAASQLLQDLAVHKNHIDMLTRRLEQVCSEVESRCEVLSKLNEFKLSSSFVLSSECSVLRQTATRFRV